MSLELLLVGGVVIPVFELLLIMAPFLLLILYFYRKSLAKSKCSVHYLYANGTADVFPATEYIGEKKLTVHLSKKESKDFAIDGLPIEFRLGPTKRERVYIIRDGAPKTFDTRLLTQQEIINILDLTTEIFYDAMNKLKTFTSTLSAGIYDNMRYHFPWLFAGIGIGMALAFLITSLFG